MTKLLVVDDSALMRKLLTQIFEAEDGFEVRTARNGAEGLALAGSFAPDVITLDVNMPEMDGITCLSRIMVECPRPVVMVSSLTSEGAEATLEALQLGAVDYVPKPGGTVSLSIDQIRPILVEKVRSAAQARLRRSVRLRDRVRHQFGQVRERSLPAPEPVRRPAPADGEAGGRMPVAGPVPGLVLVGVSTGGPQALETLLSTLPHDFPWPVLVAQHMPAAFTGVFARRMNNLSALEVLEVTRPMPLQPGFVYIGQGDADLVVGRRPGGPHAVPTPPGAQFPWHPSADRLVQSAMEQMPPQRLVGLLLTGMGNDGASAMTTLRSRGGRTIAEDESTAVVWGMPGELVRRNGADQVLPLHAVAPELIRMVS